MMCANQAPSKLANVRSALASLFRKTVGWRCSALNAASATSPPVNPGPLTNETRRSRGAVRAFALIQAVKRAPT